MERDEQMGFGRERTYPQRRTAQSGGLLPVSDARQIEPGGFNIVELFPDAYTMHFRNTAYNVVSAGGGVVNLFVPGPTMPWDWYAFAYYMELYLPVDANLTSGYLAVGTIIPAESEDLAGGLVRFDPFWQQISGTKGSKARLPISVSPYGRRGNKGERINVRLQHVVAAGANFLVEYDVQVKVLNLGPMIASGR